MKIKLISTFLTLCFVVALTPLDVLAVKFHSFAESPSVTELTVENSSGEVISLLQNGEIPTLMLDTFYTFTVSFDHTENLEKVFIISTKDGERRSLEARFDHEKNAYVTTGTFGGEGTYTPGKISVEYTERTVDIPIESEVNWSSLQKPLRDVCTAVLYESSSESLACGAVDISGLLNAERKVLIDFIVDQFDASTESDLGHWLGEYRDLEQMKNFILEDSNYYLYLDYSEPSSYALILRNVSENKYVRFVMSEAGEQFDSLAFLSKNIDTVSLSSGLAYDYLKISEDAKDLKSEIRDSSISAEKKEVLYARADDYESDRLMFTLVRTVIPMAVAASGGTMAGAAIIFNALWGAINASADFFWNYRIGMIRGCEPIETNFHDSASPCGMPLDKEFWASHDYVHNIPSGAYYVVSASNLEIGTDEKPANVVLCLHTISSLGSPRIQVNTGSSLCLCDCTYQETPDGAVNRGYARISAMDGSRITVESGSCSIVAEGSGSIIINSGLIEYVRTESGRIEIHGGSVGDIITECGTIFIDGGSIQDDKAGGTATVINKSGTLEVLGGQIEDTNDGHAIFCGENSNTYISGGYIICSSQYSNYRAVKNDGGNVLISGGKIIRKSEAGSGDYCLESTGGQLLIYGGTFQGGRLACISCNSFSRITGGSFFSGDGGIVIKNEDQLNISGGAFYGRSDLCLDNRGTANIDGGIFYGNMAETSVRASRYCIANYTGSTLAIHNGIFHGTGSECVCNYGMAAITGGSFHTDGNSASTSSAPCLVNDGNGDMVIFGGVFSATGKSDTLENQSTMLIEGGSFFNEAGRCISGKGSTTVSSGNFQGENLVFSPLSPITLLMNGYSKIELSGNEFVGVGYWAHLKAAEDYSGGVIAYDSKDASAGTVMTMEEASEELFYVNYLRLEPSAPSPKLFTIKGSVRADPRDIIRIRLFNSDGRIFTAEVTSQQNSFSYSAVVPIGQYTILADSKDEAGTLHAYQQRQIDVAGNKEVPVDLISANQTEDISLIGVGDHNEAAVAIVCSDSSQNEEAFLISAYYGQNGRLISCKMLPITIQDGMVLPLDSPSSNSCNSIAVYLLNRITFSPMSKELHV